MWYGNVGIVPHGGVPCKDCPKKGCGSYHDECQEYRAYRAKVDEVHHKFSVDNEKNARAPKQKSKLSPMAITHTHKHRR